MERQVTVTTSAAIWLGAIDELGWRRVGPGTSNINWPQVQSLIETVSVAANGERVEWCEEHRSALHVPNPLTEKRCDVWVAARLDGWDTKEPCRIVSRLLVDPPKEEEM